MPSVQEAFQGRTVLVSGGAGFLSTVLLYRLLDPATGLNPKKVYTLVRGPLAHVKMAACLRQHMDSGKLVVVEGDCARVGFGLEQFYPSKEARAWTDEVEMVMHVAADTKFNRALPDTINTNTAMAYAMAQFSMTHKNVFTHIQVSTCYATYFHPDGYHSFETLRHDFDQAGPHVNTYSQAKLIGEGIVDSFARTGSGTAWSIIRVDTITPSLRHPEPILKSASKSPIVAVLLAEMLPKGSMRKDHFLDVMPADIVADQILALTASTHFSKRYTHCAPVSYSTPVFHVANPGRPLTGEFTDSLTYRVSNPSVPAAVLKAAYQPIFAKLVVFSTERARKALGLAPLTIGEPWTMPESQRPVKVDMSDIVTVDTTGLHVDPEQAIDQAGGWPTLMMTIKNMAEAIRAAKVKTLRKTKSMAKI